MKLSGAVLVLLCFGVSYAFVPSSSSSPSALRSTTTVVQQTTATTTIAETTDELKIQKDKLLNLIGKSSDTNKDLVLADPVTKEPVAISATGVLLGGSTASRGPQNVQFKIQSPTNSYSGSSGTFINLLEPIIVDDANSDGSSSSSRLSSILLKRVLPLVPLFLRQPLAAVTDLDSEGEEVIPMRDLFTSPAVSFAYERGWRQNFNVAGFPGPDTESLMAMDYFAPVVARAGPNSVVVDMSCATGK
jgi:hypothetical protein